MAKARVNVDAIQKVISASSDVGSCASCMRSTASSCIERIASHIKGDVRKLNECLQSCQAALAAGQAKISSLDREISQISSNMPSPTRRVESVVGYDEDGAKIWESHIETNPEYEIAQQRLHQLNIRRESIYNVSVLLQSKMNIISDIVRRLGSANSEISNQKTSLTEKAASISSKTERAKTKLNKAVAAVHRYMSVSASLNSVPQPHTSMPSSSYYNSTVSRYESYTPPPRRSSSSASARTSAPKPKPLAAPKPPERTPSARKPSASGGFELKWKRSNPVDMKKGLSQSNPNYDMGEEWQTNCQHCVPAYEMRRRGYNVVSRPLQNHDDVLLKKPFEAWVNPQILSARGDGKADITKFLSGCGDGARVQVVIYWKNFASGHTFVAEQIDGKPRFIDPQSGEEDVEYYFDSVKSDRTKYARIDRLEPTKYILDCCEEI